MYKREILGSVKWQYQLSVAAMGGQTDFDRKIYTSRYRENRPVDDLSRYAGSSEGVGKLKWL